MVAKTARKPAVKPKEDSKQKDTISAEKMAYLESFSPAVRKLERELSNRLSRGDMNWLISERPLNQIDILAKRYGVTAEDVIKCLDLVAFQRKL